MKRPSIFNNENTRKQKVTALIKFSKGDYGTKNKKLSIPGEDFLIKAILQEGLNKEFLNS